MAYKRLNIDPKKYPKLDLNRNQLMELKKMKDLQHDHITRYRFPYLISHHQFQVYRCLYRLSQLLYSDGILSEGVTRGHPGQREDRTGQYDEVLTHPRSGQGVAPFEFSLFHHTGSVLPPQFGDQEPRKTEVFKLCGRQPLCIESHRLWSSQLTSAGNTADDRGSGRTRLLQE